jgi:omega-6 fatty acid desaturase (delta-12 desaturase)
MSITNTQINESELYTKYKSSYQGAFIDLSVHTVISMNAFYLLWYFRYSLLSVFTIPLLSLLTLKTFVIFHDCCHNSYTPNRKLNYVLAYITGIPTLISPLWGIDHSIHHLTSGNRKNIYNYKYNEVIEYTEAEYLSMKPIVRNIYSIVYNYKVYFSVIPMIYFFIFQRFGYFMKKIKYGDKIKETMSYIVMNHLMNNISLLLFALCLHHYNILLHYIIVTYITAILGFILFQNQHTFNPPYVVDNAAWNVKDSGLLGSSFIQIPEYLKYFVGGIEYHHIHHVNAKIPGYNLRKYHEEVVATSNLFDNVVKLSIYDCFENIKFRLFSEEKHRYIRLDEVSKKSD